MFIVRKTKPEKGNKNYITTSKGGWNTCIKGNPTDKDCNVLANCVGYASGRFNEIYNELTGNTGCKFHNLNCNAEGFIERAKKLGLEIGQTPKPGAIICWQKGATLSGSDGAGHVAIVEQVIDNNTIYTSESGYGNKTPFWNATRKNNNGKWGIGAGYTLRGFIYNPAVKEEPTTNIYIIKKGDTLSKIYKDLGYSSWQELYKENKDAIGEDPNLIEAGTKIKIKQKQEAQFYIVQKGDYLIKIGKKFGVDWKSIAKLNNIKAPFYIIKKGQQLRIK